MCSDAVLRESSSARDGDVVVALKRVLKRRSRFARDGRVDRRVPDEYTSRGKRLKLECTQDCAWILTRHDVKIGGITAFPPLSVVRLWRYPPRPARSAPHVDGRVENRVESRVESPRNPHVRPEASIEPASLQRRSRRARGQRVPIQGHPQSPEDVLRHEGESHSGGTSVDEALGRVAPVWSFAGRARDGGTVRLPRRPAVCEWPNSHGPHAQQSTEGLCGAWCVDGGSPCALCARLGYARTSDRTQGDDRTAREGEDGKARHVDRGTAAHGDSP